MATWVITGAGRGVGLELARQLHAKGEVVIATARDPSSSHDLAALGLRTETLDVADAQSVRKLASALAGEPVDVLVNNAGVGGMAQSIDQLDFERAERYFAVNSLGPLRVAQALLPNLRSGRRKLVAQIGSKMSSLELMDGRPYYFYRASKTALNMLNRSLAAELGPEGFICVLIHPGWVRTNIGGPEAPLSTAESVTALLQVMANLAPAHNGRLLDITGDELPW